MPLFSLVCLLIAANTGLAGNVYQVTSLQGDKSITYEVSFGGGRRMEQFTAFDPDTKEFVYLKFDRNGEPPTPAMKIWDYRTGETIPLFTFPNVKNPLPLIPSMEAMKVCPITGDKNFKSKLHIIFD